MSSHSETCRCALHLRLEQRLLESRRHSSYRMLANAILGPAAPREDSALTRALAEHARLVRQASFSNLNDLRAA